MVSLNSLEKVLVHRAINTEINFLLKLYSTTDEEGTVNFKNETFGQQVKILVDINDRLYQEEDKEVL